MKRETLKVAIMVPLKAERRGQKPNVILVRYHPGFKEAYAIVSQDDGDHGPLSITTFGDDALNQRRLRKAWRDWEKDEPGNEIGLLEWTPKSAVAAFVRWLNSGGEARLAQQRETRRHGGRA